MPNAQSYMLPAVTVEADEPVSKVVSLLRNQKQAAHVLVTQRGKYAGLVDDRALRKFQGNAETTKVITVAKQATKLSPDATPEEIVQAFLNTDNKVLPVLKDGKALGVVPRAAAIQILLQSPAVSGKKVEDFMTKPAVTITEDTHIDVAEHTMRGNGISRLVVVDGRGRLAGVLSTYDLATKVKPSFKTSRREATFRPGENVSVEAGEVSGVMTPVPSVATVSPTSSIKEALQTMLQKGLSNLVVAKENKPIGIFTVRDALEVVSTIPRQHIFVFGLKEDEKMLRQSLVDEAQAFIERLAKSAPVDYVSLQLRSTPEGMKRRYEVRARVNINGHLHAAGTPDLDPHRKMWDAGMAVREVLGKVEKLFYKHEKRGHPRQKRFEARRYLSEE